MTLLVVITFFVVLGLGGIGLAAETLTNRPKKDAKSELPLSENSENQEIVGQIKKLENYYKGLVSIDTITAPQIVLELQRLSLYMSRLLQISEETPDGIQQQLRIKYLAASTALYKFLEDEGMGDVLRHPGDYPNPDELRSKAVSSIISLQNQVRGDIKTLAKDKVLEMEINEKLTNRNL